MDPPARQRQPLRVWTRNFEPFPLTEIRDLLGLARVLYLHARDRDPGRAGRLARAGALLARAVELGAQCRTGTGGHASAWKDAEDGWRIMADCIDPLEPAEPLVETAATRVLRGMKR